MSYIFHKKNIYKAFTLAEVLIAFAVAGVLMAILVPTLIAAAPDFAMLKAKKAYFTFGKAVEGMLNSGPYDTTNGDLNASYFFANSSDSSKRLRFFCNNLASVLNIKDSDCTMDEVNTYIVYNHSESTSDSWACTSGSFATDDGTRKAICQKNLDYLSGSEKTDPDYSRMQKVFDASCEAFFDNTTASDYNIKTADNVLYSIQLTNFSHTSTLSQDYGTAANIEYSPNFYNLVCIDTKNHTSSDYIFGIGINRKGNIIPGYKLQKYIVATQQEF